MTVLFEAFVEPFVELVVLPWIPVATVTILASNVEIFASVPEFLSMSKAAVNARLPAHDRVLVRLGGKSP